MTSKGGNTSDLSKHMANEQKINLQKGSVLDYLDSSRPSSPAASDGVQSLIIRIRRQMKAYHLHFLLQDFDISCIDNLEKLCKHTRIKRQFIN